MKTAQEVSTPDAVLGTPQTMQVGQRFTHRRECDRFRPMYYAAASGDFNPIHIDKEFGEMAGLGGVILHGMCTLSWAVEACLLWTGRPASVKSVAVRFARPVSLEDTIEFNGEVIALTDSSATIQMTAINQRGEEVLKALQVEVTR